MKWIDKGKIRIKEIYSEHFNQHTKSRIVGDPVEAWRNAIKVLNYMYDTKVLYLKAVMQPRIEEQLKKDAGMHGRWTDRFYRLRIHPNCRCKIDGFEGQMENIADELEYGTIFLEKCTTCHRLAAKIVEAGMGWYRTRCDKCGASIVHEAIEI